MKYQIIRERRSKRAWLGLLRWFALGWGLWGLSGVHSQQLFIDSGEMPNTVERMYVRGMDYLKQTQMPGGHWPEARYGSEPAVVGVSVVCLLAHGDDPMTGPYSETIRSALDFLLKDMNSKTGYIGTSMYNHGFATLALAEAYGVVLDDRIGPALQKAVELIVTSQKNNPMGAWRYSPESKDADTTVSGAQMVALFAARNAGIAVPEEAIQKGLDFFRECQSPNGGIGYTSQGSPNGIRTAIGALVFGLGKQKNTPEYRAAVEYFQSSPPPTGYYDYYLYYTSQAYFHSSQEAWRRWNTENIKNLMEMQGPDGSWDGQFGKTLATSFSLLSLALNYRFLPIYER